MKGFKFTEEERDAMRNDCFDNDQNSVAQSKIDFIESIISSRPEPEQGEIKLPCGCDPDHSPVFWNQYNGVVQCHRCGRTYIPRVKAERGITIAKAPEPDESGAEEVLSQVFDMFQQDGIKKSDDILYPPINSYHKKIIYAAMRQFAAQEVSRALVAKDEYIINLMDNFGYETGVLESALTAANKRIAELEKQIKSARNQGRRDHAEAMESDY